MKFKVKKGSETHKKLIALQKRITDVNKQANKFIESIGAKEYCRNQHHAYGGVGAIKFNEKPEGWRKEGAPYQRLYMPKSAQKELWSKINALPVIEYDEINKIVGFHAPQTVECTGGLAWIKCIGIHWGRNDILLETVEGSQYKPPKDIVEILESEYVKLKGTQKEN